MTLWSNVHCYFRSEFLRYYYQIIKCLDRVRAAALKGVQVFGIKMTREGHQIKEFLIEVRVALCLGRMWYAI
jgi:hypothetical protein